jgi:hypothetical protein
VYNFLGTCNEGLDNSKDLKFDSPGPSRLIPALSSSSPARKLVTPTYTSESDGTCAMRRNMLLAQHFKSAARVKWYQHLQGPIVF